MFQPHWKGVYVGYMETLLIIALTCVALLGLVIRTSRLNLGEVRVEPAGFPREAGRAARVCGGASPTMPDPKPRGDARVPQQPVGREAVRVRRELRGREGCPILSSTGLARERFVVWPFADRCAFARQSASPPTR